MSRVHERSHRHLSTKGEQRHGRGEAVADAKHPHVRDSHELADGKAIHEEEDKDADG